MFLSFRRQPCRHSPASGSPRRASATVLAAMSAAAALGLTAVLPLPSARAELLIGLTVQNNLLSFDSATPGTVSSVGITGLLAGDALVGIDRRPTLGPNNGVLYGFGYNATTGAGRIYTLDTLTGLATPGAFLTADPTDVTAPFPFTTVMGSAFGMDFNPVPDRLRVTSDTGQNLRINVDNGFTQLDVPLAYQAGDPNVGTTPNVVAVAYSNNFGGATTTTLRGVDVGKSPDLLVVHTNPNGGLLQTSLNLPFDGSNIAAYDISGLTGTPYFAVSAPGAGFSQLYTSGPGGVTLAGTIGGGVTLRGLAAPVGAPVGTPQVIPEPGTLALAVTGLLPLAVVIARRRHRT